MLRENRCAIFAQREQHQLWVWVWVLWWLGVGLGFCLGARKNEKPYMPHREFAGSRACSLCVEAWVLSCVNKPMELAVSIDARSQRMYHRQWSDKERHENAYAPGSIGYKPHLAKNKSASSAPCKVSWAGGAWQGDGGDWAGGVWAGGARAGGAWAGGWASDGWAGGAWAGATGGNTSHGQPATGGQSQQPVPSADPSPSPSPKSDTPTMPEYNVVQLPDIWSGPWWGEGPEAAKETKADEPPKAISHTEDGEWKKGDGT